MKGLLPQRTPAILGVDVAATCLPAGGGTEVGGDWYDVIELDSGAVGFAIGDVVGRGAAATARVPGLRDGLRAYALEGRPPGEVLRGLNGLASDTRTEMSTALFVVYTPATGELRGANAGHPPAIISRGGGRVERWDAARSVPLGVDAGAVFEEDAVQLDPGDVVLLFTDGLIERRDVGIGEALDLLELAIPTACSADDLRSAVLDRMLAGQAHDDDVAVLAFGLPG